MYAQPIQLFPILWDPMDCSSQFPLFLEFSRQEYWSGLPRPPPRDLPNSGNEPVSLTSPASAGKCLLLVLPGKPLGQGCCCSVALLCLTLCDPMDCSTPSFPVHHHLTEIAQTMSLESMMPSNHLILCCPLLLLPPSFPASGSFLTSQIFTSGGQSIGASASVLPMNIQD